MKTRVQFVSILIATTIFFAAPASADSWVEKAQWCFNNPITCVKDNSGKVATAAAAIIAVTQTIGRFKKPKETPAGTNTQKSDAVAEQLEGRNEKDKNTDGTSTPKSDASTQPHKDSGEYENDPENDGDDGNNPLDIPIGDGAPLPLDAGASLGTRGIGNLNIANDAFESQVAAYQQRQQVPPSAVSIEQEQQTSQALGQIEQSEIKKPTNTQKKLPTNKKTKNRTE